MEGAVVLSFLCLRRRVPSLAHLRPGNLEPGAMIVMSGAVEDGGGVLKVVGDFVRLGGFDGRVAAGVCDCRVGVR